MAFSSNESPSFLLAQPGDFVAISPSQGTSVDWWIGQIITRVGSSSDPSINTLFQVVDVDTGSVRIINADCVKGII